MGKVKEVEYINLVFLKHYPEIHFLSSHTLKWKKLKKKSLCHGRCVYENGMIVADPNLPVTKSGDANYYCLTNGIDEIVVCAPLNQASMFVTEGSTITLMPFKPITFG